MTMRTERLSAWFVGAVACMVELGSAGTKPAAAAAAAAEAEGGPGPTFTIGGGFLKLGVCAPDVIRVAFARDPAFFGRPTLATAARRCVPTPFDVVTDKPAGISPRATGPAGATLTTARLKVRIDFRSGAVRFLDLAGRTILAERSGGRTLEPAGLDGAGPADRDALHVRQQWEPNPDESLYGLGQHANGLLDLKDHDLELRQYNTEIFIPFLVSSRGYGVLWDNTSFTRFGDLSPAVPLPGVTGLYGATARSARSARSARPARPDARPGSGPTTATATPTPLPGDVATGGSGTFDWTGTVTPTVTGDYTFRTYSAGDIKLRVGGELVIDHWRQGWLPNEDVARVHLTGGKPVRVQLQWTRDIGVDILRLLWKPPLADRTTSLWSKVGDGIDYTFVYGPSLDRVIAGYRQLTGQAPMPPRWSFGLWQSRERYANQAQSLEVLAGFRTRQIPVDAIVQDWRYWPEGTWGSHVFDPRRFPDPSAWIARIHGEGHAHLMISVWPKFYPGTANFAALDAAGFLYRPNLLEGKKDFLGQAFTYYDAFNPEARRLYWSQIERDLFAHHVDAWWMDASEPDVVEGPFPSIAAQVATYESHMTPTAAGSGARVLNAYCLVNSQGIFEGQRAAAPRQRVFLLTRNGFAGQQRYGAVSWSGDISSTWTAMRRQIPAGLGFALSGMPYWTMDAGGFSVPGRFTSAARGSPALDEWRELNARWFAYATFLPILRVHGQAPKREMWELGGEGSPAYEAEKKLDRLRYRLLPYVYALAGGVTHDAGTILRPLVMDFPADTRARQLTDEYLFGPALLVSPITTFKARARTVYLPATTGGWYDFWTGEARAAGTLEVAAALDAIPLHARAGSILPLGPDLQYTDEKPADPITLVVYTGADASFTLIEDDGITNDAEQGAYTRIPLRWTEATRALAIGDRQGSYPGMLAARTFQIVFVTPRKATPFSFAPRPDRVVRYDGHALVVPETH